MSGATSRPRTGHLAPFLADLIARSPHKLYAVADDAGVTRTRLSSACYSPQSISLDSVLRIVRAAGGKPEDEQRARLLHALDRGVLTLPDGCDERRLAAAVAVLEAL